jgi:hypothetical protein
LNMISTPVAFRIAYTTFSTLCDVYSAICI